MWKSLNLFYLFLILLLATPLFSQGGGDSVNTQSSEYTPPDRVGLLLGYFGPSFEASVRVNSKTLGLGTFVSLENSFELPSSQDIFRIEAHFRFSKHHSIKAGYYTSTRDGTSVIEQEIRIGDVVFPIGSIAIADEKFSLLKLIYNYSIVNSEDIESGVSVGFSLMNYALNAKKELLGIEEEVNVDETLPIPTVGFFTTYHLWKNFDLLFYLNFFSLKIDIYDGVLTDLAFAAQYKIIDHIRIGLGYNIFKIDVGVEGSQEFEGRIDYLHKGIAFYALFTF